VNGRSGCVACSTSERAHAERAGFTAAESMWAAALPTAEYITALDVDLRADLGPDSGWRGGIDPLDLDLRHLALIPLGSVNSKKFERLAGARRLRVGKRDAVVQDRAEVFDCYRGRVSRGRGRDSCHRVHSRVAVGSASRRRRGDPSQHRNSGRNHNADRAAVLFQLGENLPRLGACEARRARSRRNGNAPSP